MAEGIESQRRLFRSIFREIAFIQLGLDTGEVASRANETAASRLVQLMERGQRRGDVSNALSPESLAAAFHSLTNGTITNWLYHDPAQPLTIRLRDAADVFISPIAQSRRARPAKKGSTK
jgi:hypothetical protein